MKAVTINFLWENIVKIAQFVNGDGKEHSKPSAGGTHAGPPRPQMPKK